jgi:cell division protein ZapA
MNTEREPLTVNILDREYQFTCLPEEREALREAAQLLDGRMREIKASGNLMALERVAVMTALNMSDEILKLRAQQVDRVENVDKRIRFLADQLDDALASGID